MYRVCVAVGRDAAIASDGVQAAWKIAWRKLGTVRDAATAQGVARRHRGQRDEVAAEEAAPKRSLAEVAWTPSGRPGGIDPAAGVASIDLRTSLERLDPDERALLAMRYVAGFDATELATAIGISPSGTRTRLERLMARLRQELT